MHDEPQGPELVPDEAPGEIIALSPQQLGMFAELLQKREVINSQINLVASAIAAGSSAMEGEAKVELNFEAGTLTVAGA